MQELLTNKTIEKLKHDLVREGLVSDDNLLTAQKEAQKNNINLAQALIKLLLIKEEDLLNFIESKLHIPYVDLDDYRLDKKCLNIINPKDAIQYKLIPLFKIEDVLTVAMADPLDLFTINNIIKGTSFKIEPIICSEANIYKAVKEYYNIEITKPVESEKDHYDWREELTSHNLEFSRIENIIKAIIKQAAKEKCLEISFKPTEYGLGVNFNIADEILNKGDIPRLYIPLFVSTLKTLSNLDPYTKDVPQLGKLKITIEDQKFIVRVSTFQVVEGESIVLKIFAPPASLENLPIRPQKLEYLNESLNNKGLVLVCGEKNTGKTSLVYSTIEYAGKDKNVFTVESTVKYEISNINQSELNEAVGFNIEKALSHIEFQNPDIIYFEDFINSQSVNAMISFIENGLTIISELRASTINDVIDKIKKYQLNKLVSCIIFINEQDNISVLDSSDIEKLA